MPRCSPKNRCAIPYPLPRSPRRSHGLPVPFYLGLPDAASLDTRERIIWRWQAAKGGASSSRVSLNDVQTRARPIRLSGGTHFPVSTGATRQGR